MPYTGTEIFNIAIAVIDELSDTGTVVDSQVREYKNKAPYLLDLWQHELKKIEGIAELEKITTLDQTLQVSDEGCMSGAYYLALHFAITNDMPELAALCQAKYEATKDLGRKPAAGTGIIDVYGVTATPPRGQRF